MAQETADFRFFGIQRFPDLWIVVHTVVAGLSAGLHTFRSLFPSCVRQKGCRFKRQGCLWRHCRLKHVRRAMPGVSFSLLKTLNDIPRHENDRLREQTSPSPFPGAGD